MFDEGLLSRLGLALVKAEEDRPKPNFVTQARSRGDAFNAQQKLKPSEKIQTIFRGKDCSRVMPTATILREKYCSPVEK